MTDRRDFWSKASADVVAQMCDQHNLKHTTPKTHRVILPVADLCTAPNGARDRQLLRGAAFNVHATSQSGWSFGEVATNGYSGWIDTSALGDPSDDAPTHRVASAKTYAKTTSGLKTQGHITPLSMGSELTVLSEQDGWSKIAWSQGPNPQVLYVPSPHLTPLGKKETDPVSVAERLIGTPYLWGGNSAFGIDCSGLVQMACHACAIPCPGDSDQQEKTLGHTPPAEATPQRGDLYFWKGHVAWVVDTETLLHANAHDMAVAYEPVKDAVARIKAQGEGPVTRHARLTKS